MDEYVMVRLAQMIDEGSALDAIDRAIANWSYESIRRHADTLKAKLGP